MRDSGPQLKIYNPDDLPVRPAQPGMREPSLSPAPHSVLNSMRDERRLLADLELEFGSSVRCFLSHREQDQVFAVSQTKDGGFQLAMRVEAAALNPEIGGKEALRPVSIRAVFGEYGDFKSAYIGSRTAERPELVVSLIDLAVARRTEQSMAWEHETYEDLPREILKPHSTTTHDQEGCG